MINDALDYRAENTYLSLRRTESLEIEIGGLLVLDETSLLKTVLQKADSVLLERNLKSYIGKYSQTRLQVSYLL